jgi:SAM-dependent methyltransferase
MTDASPRYGAADTVYPVAFQPEASPARIHLALTLAGIAWNPPDRDRLTVLDIGCGRGLTASLLAAANPGWEVIGLDLQPAHIAEAREFAAEAGLSNLRFLEADLAEFDAALLPELDLAICYGVWSWVADEVRQGIVQLLRRRLRPGGVVLMGYNALPAQADLIVLQRLLQDAAGAVAGTAAERGALALAALETLRDAGSPYLPAPAVLDAIIAKARRVPGYMAHEWLSGCWRPVFAADLARDLAPAGLEPAGPVRPASGRAELQLRPAQQAALAALPPGMDREFALDLFLDRRFRTDLFVRGRRPAPAGEIARIRFALAADPGHARVALRTGAGMASLTPAQQEAILGALLAGPRPVGELAALPAAAGLSAAEIALLLAESFAAHPLWRDPGAGDAAARRCNAAILRRFGAEARMLEATLAAACPALGGGLALSPGALALVVALQAGVPAAPAALVARLAPHLDDPEARAAMAEEIGRTLAERLGAWRGLGLV